MWMDRYIYVELVRTSMKIGEGKKQCMLRTRQWVAFIVYWLWKDSLNSDGQQFHQSQQNEQSPLTTNHWTYEGPWHKIGNPGPGVGQA